MKLSNEVSYIHLPYGFLNSDKLVHRTASMKKVFVKRECIIIELYGTRYVIDSLLLTGSLIYVQFVKGQNYNGLDASQKIFFRGEGGVSQNCFKNWVVGIFNIDIVFCWCILAINDVRCTCLRIKYLCIQVRFW